MGRAGRASSFDRPRRAQRARLRLRAHPEAGATALETVEAEIIRKAGGQIDIAFYALGDTAAVLWPEPTVPGHADRLWEHTCFELFVAAQGREGYYEFNFSPSGEWAAYRFSGYRAGMQMARGVSAPEIALRTAPRAQVLSVSLDLGRAPALPDEEDWPVAISAVIEAVDGTRSYWALAHADGAPDFHHADCFALTLAAPLQP